MGLPRDGKVQTTFRISQDKLYEFKMLCLEKRTTAQEMICDYIDSAIEEHRREKEAREA